MEVDRPTRKTNGSSGMVAFACCHFLRKPWHWVHTGLKLAASLSFGLGNRFHFHEWAYINDSKTSISFTSVSHVKNYCSLERMSWFDANGFPMLAFCSRFSVSLIVKMECNIVGWFGSQRANSKPNIFEVTSSICDAFYLGY